MGNLSSKWHYHLPFKQRPPPWWRKYDAEIMGAFKALGSAITFVEGQKIYAILDNQAAVLALQTGKSASSLGIVRRFQELARTVIATVKWGRMV